MSKLTLEQKEELEAELLEIGNQLENLWDKYGLENGILEVQTCSGILENGLYTHVEYPNGDMCVGKNKAGWRSEYPNTWMK